MQQIMAIHSTEFAQSATQHVRFLSRSKKVLMTRYRRCKWFEWFDIELASQARIILVLDTLLEG